MASANYPPRPLWVLGNWKMNPCSAQEAIDLAASLKVALSKSVQGKQISVGVAPTFLHLCAVQSALQGSDILVLAQDCANTPSTGAYTGEVSAAQLKASHVSWLILGHSERRSLYAETNAIVAQKLQIALAADLCVVLCVGESGAEREAGLAQQVVISQVVSALENIDLGTCLDRLVIAYEPVWAIGTGKTATPEDAQTMHACIRQTLARIAPALSQIPIVYGGSVKSDNAALLAACPDVDGALVGGASLVVSSFVDIIHAFVDVKLS